MDAPARGTVGTLCVEPPPVMSVTYTLSLSSHTRPTNH